MSYGCCRVLQCVVVCCSVLQFFARIYQVTMIEACHTGVAGCCRVLQCVARIYQVTMIETCHTGVALCCRGLQCVAVCCSVLHAHIK